MRVAEEDDFRIGVGSIQLLRCRDAEGVAVSEQEPKSVDFDVHYVGEPIAEREAVRVAVHGGDGSDCFQFIQDIERTDVTGVEDPIDLLEDGKDFGAQEAVGIRDDPETHSPASAPAPALAPPALGDLDIEGEVVEDALNDEIHQFFDPGGTMVESRRRRQHDGAGFGDPSQILQVN